MQNLRMLGIGGKGPGILWMVENTRPIEISGQGLGFSGLGTKEKPHFSQTAREMGHS